MSAIVFSHGNSFPASTYRVMLDSLRARGYQVSAIEKYGHDPAYPVTDSWPHLVRQLADRGVRVQIGHTLGSYEDGVAALEHGASGFTLAWAGKARVRPMRWAFISSSKKETSTSTLEQSRAWSAMSGARVMLRMRISSNVSPA